jgi:hypothetical protein
MKKYELTAADRAQFEPWRDRWISNAMSTKQMDAADKRAVIIAVNGLYEAANLPPPKHIVFVPSPFVMCYAGGLSAAIWWLHNKGKPSRDATRDATSDATRDATRAATRAATSAATLAATRAATRDATRAATRDATHDATRAATSAATHDATRDATSDAELDNWYVTLSPGEIGSLSKTFLDPQYALFALECIKSVAYWSMWDGGNQWSGWIAYLSFFKDVVKLELPEYEKFKHYESAAIHAGPRVMHPDFCIVSDRPEILKVDDQNRPHCDDGPFCRWRDGSALYSVHGVRVPAWLIECPDRLTIKTIEAEQNAEVRRVMIERYGSDRYLIDSGAGEIHRDDFGILYRKEIAGDEALVMVKVINSTAEPDGSFKDYFLRVPPQMKRAKEAVAWTFGKEESEYAPLIET